MPFLWMRKRARTSLGLREDQEKTRALGGLSPHSTEVRTNSLRRLCLVPGFLSEVKRQKKKKLSSGTKSYLRKRDGSKVSEEGQPRL